MRRVGELEVEVGKGRKRARSPRQIRRRRRNKIPRRATITRRTRRPARGLRPDGGERRTDSRRRIGYTGCVLISSRSEPRCVFIYCTICSRRSLCIILWPYRTVVLGRSSRSYVSVTCRMAAVCLAGLDTLVQSNSTHVISHLACTEVVLRFGTMTTQRDSIPSRSRQKQASHFGFARCGNTSSPGHFGHVTSHRM